MSQLTIGIPTYNRPKLLPRALKAAIQQTVPVRIVVADDGDPEPTERILASDEFRGQDIRHLITGATSAWPNWRAAAEACDTEYFAWLQDDDTIRDTYAERIIDVLDYFPDTDLWLARLQSGFTDTLAMGYKGNGPWCPMDFLTGKPARWLGGDILAISSYLTSWSLCPAQAYRDGDRFRAMLELMPDETDMFIERLVPAYMAVGAPIICDPIVAGYWIQHGRMLHQEQSADPGQRIGQFTRFLGCLDQIFDQVLESEVNWQRIVKHWLGWIPADFVVSWLKSLDELPAAVDRGRHLATVTDYIRGLNPVFARPAPADTAA